MLNTFINTSALNIVICINSKNDWQIFGLKFYRFSFTIYNQFDSYNQSGMYYVMDENLQYSDEPNETWYTFGKKLLNTMTQQKWIVSIKLKNVKLNFDRKINEFSTTVSFFFYHAIWISYCIIFDMNYFHSPKWFSFSYMIFILLNKN